MPKPFSVVILQSNYIPWRGYFDLISRANLFVFHDDLQYTKGDWRNRNQIRTPSGNQWLSVPVGQSQSRLICEVEISDPTWQKQHFDKIYNSYHRAPHFDAMLPFLEQNYLSTNWTTLTELNQSLIKEISGKYLGLDTEFLDSRTLELSEKKGERVLEILAKTGAEKYVSGPSAMNYLSQEMFLASSIELEWIDYSDYVQYPQIHSPFDDRVSIVDLIANTGHDARNIFNRRKNGVK